MRTNEMPEGFDWLTTLEALSKDGHISQERSDELEGLAQQWPTCACGQLCTQLERDPDGSPKDRKLQALGVHFLTNVSEKQWCVALKTFNQIERRTVRLLKLELCEKGGEK